MITNSILFSPNKYSHGQSTGGQRQHRNSAEAPSTVLIVGEYFVSATQPAATSKIDYLSSPIQQIRDQLNDWLTKIGKRTQIQCDDSALIASPASKISPEFFDKYEPFFKTIFLYQARLEMPDREGSTPPSDIQLSAACLGLANLMAAFIPAPSPMLLEDGVIGGFWRRGTYYASIDFEIDGEHTWVEADGEKFTSGTWKLPGEPLPPALARDLLALSS